MLATEEKRNRQNTSFTKQDLNSNMCSSITQDADFIQDNSDYQWFLDYGYRETGKQQPVSILSSLCESYRMTEESGTGFDSNLPDGYYDVISRNMDANLAEADMESFKTQDIHSLLTTLPAMCNADLPSLHEGSYQGEMYASMSGSLMDKIRLDSSLSPHNSSQDEDLTNSMSICKSELLFSPIKESLASPGKLAGGGVGFGGAGVNYSVDSLDLFNAEKDIILTCNTNNYTIAFEGSITEEDDYSSNSIYHKDGLEKLIQSQTKERAETTAGYKRGNGNGAVSSTLLNNRSSAMAKSESSANLTTWSKLKNSKINKQTTQLRRHPSGNNNTTHCFDTSNGASCVAAAASDNQIHRSHSLPNLSRNLTKLQQNQFVANHHHQRALSNSSIESYNHQNQNGCIQVYDIQNAVSGCYSGYSTSAGTTTSTSEGSSQQQFNLVKRFIKQKSLSADHQIWQHSPSNHNCCLSTTSDSNGDRFCRASQQYKRLSQQQQKQGNKIVNRPINNWSSGCNETCVEHSNLFEDSLVDGKVVNVVYKIDCCNNNYQYNTSNTQTNCQNQQLCQKSQQNYCQNEVGTSSSIYSMNSVCNNSSTESELTKIQTKRFQRATPSPEFTNASVQTSHQKLAAYHTTHSQSINQSLNSSIPQTKLISNSFLQNLRRAGGGGGGTTATKQPIYVLYPNYTLPDLEFLNNDLANILLLPQQYMLPTTILKPTNRDLDWLKRKGLNHINDWESLQFLLPNKYQNVFPKSSSKPPTTTRPISCDLTNVSSSASSSQPSSGYRGSSTILTSESMQQNSPLFVYKYDSFEVDRDGGGQRPSETKKRMFEFNKEIDDKLNQIIELEEFLRQSLCNSSSSASSSSSLGDAIDSDENLLKLRANVSKFLDLKINKDKKFYLNEPPIVEENENELSPKHKSQNRLSQIFDNKSNDQKSQRRCSLNLEQNRLNDDMFNRVQQQPPPPRSCPLNVTTNSTSGCKSSICHFHTICCCTESYCNCQVAPTICQNCEHLQQFVCLKQLCCQKNNNVNNCQKNLKNKHLILTTDDDTDEYTDSLEHNSANNSPKKPIQLNDESKNKLIETTRAGGDKLAAPPLKLNNGFKKLREKWESITNWERNDDNGGDVIAHHRIPKTKSLSKIPRLMPSPVRSKSSEFPLATIKPEKKSRIPTSANNKRQSMTDLKNNRTSRMDTTDKPRAETTNEKCRPSSLPHKLNEKKELDATKRRAVSNSTPRIQVLQKKQDNNSNTSSGKDVKAIRNRSANESGHLSYKKGDQLKVLVEVDSRWLLCSLGPSKGLVPKTDIQSL